MDATQTQRTHKAPELLSPAGTQDAFKAALAAGADAIYCGLGSFNARRNADNLDLDQLRECCELAHLAGARVYITVNILIAQEEMPRALALVHDCHLAGADAFIMADWGLISLTRTLWPQIEIHLSTQGNVNDAAGVRFAKEAGCSRVTLSREMTLPEIESCSHEGVELEVFAHGAICVCYSGLCLLSSMQRGKSANRGLCRQPCRLPYRLVDEKGTQRDRMNGTRLMSPRDNCTIADIDALVEAGCASMKLEGRMKAPDYVGTVTKAYRAALDEWEQGEDPRVDAAVMRDLARAFNRNFTDGYLHGKHGNDFMSYERGNNRGQYAGSIIQAKGKKAIADLTEPVGVGDLLEIRNPDNFDDYVTAPCPRTTDGPTQLALDLPRAMGPGCDVRVIRSEHGMTQAREFAARAWPRKRAVHVHVIARLGEPFFVELETIAGDAHPDMGRDVVRARAAGFCVEAARSRAVSEEDLREHVGRFGTSPFEAASWDIEMDEGVGMSFSAVHAVRAEAVQALKDEILKPWTNSELSTAPAPLSLSARKRRGSCDPSQAKLCAHVTTPEDAQAALEAGADLVYVSAIDLALGPASSARRRTDTPGQTDAAWPDGVICILPAVARTADHAAVDALDLTGAREIAVSNVSWLEEARKGKADIWLTDEMELHNAPAFEFMAAHGVTGAWLSCELDLLEISQLAATSELELGMKVWGHIRTMTCEHCMLQSMGDCSKTCATCARRSLKLEMRDEFDRPSIVTSDALGRAGVWQAEVLDATPQMAELMRCGVSRFGVDCRLCDSPQETTEAVRHVKAALEAVRNGKMAAPRAASATSGHLFERIG